MHDVNFRIVTRSGEVRWISHSCRAVFDTNGKWIGRRASNRDITERKKADVAIQESEERFSKAFHNSPVPQIITRFSDWRYIDANDSVLNLLGYSREELIGHTSTELNLIPPSRRDQGYESLMKKANCATSKPMFEQNQAKSSLYSHPPKQSLLTDKNT